MNNHHQILEFNCILSKLADHALSETAKNKCLSLTPYFSEREAKKHLEDTTQAKRIICEAGSPPLSAMADLEKLITLTEAGDMLLPDQLEKFMSFFSACKRLKQYLKRAQSASPKIGSYGSSIIDLTILFDEIDRCIRHGRVDSAASKELYNVRRKSEQVNDQIKAKLTTILSKNKAWFSDSFVSFRGGHYTLPVKREHKNNVPGSVIEISNTGGTCFIEPSSVSKLQQEYDTLEIEEDCEIRRILYTLTAEINDALPDIRRNIEAMETLDFLFAKAKLSIAMKAGPISLTTERIIRIESARHPLLCPEAAVPLCFTLGGETRGMVITGPNTGGKTVTLKTVGLLSLMAQSGLHVPAEEASVFTMNNLFLCDIGDGQSISENLSTFSSHMKNVIGILEEATDESLVLLDELGSGTDPAEGMGLAIAILEELCNRGCLFVTTTHYPEVKDYAIHREGLENARMAFDRQTLTPLYRLEMGEAGESCALYIAQRLGMPDHIIKNASSAAYSTKKLDASPSDPHFLFHPSPNPQASIPSPKIVPDLPAKPVSSVSQQFNIGDSVVVYPEKEIGIVFATANEKGEVGVQVKKTKKMISHKRIKLQVSASQLYPENYDFSILFDTVETRKTRHQMTKHHDKNNMIILEEGSKEP
ncbi:MAG: DNA mismatch repair protein MutS [Clostridiales bacterium 43-6]|nr:MAG: DNA mismatch repair protein MutS [Clostridiales bacterium 43-6]